MTRRRLGALAAIALAALAITPFALGVHFITAPTPSALPGSASDLEEEWDAILEGAVDGAEVDYAMLASRRPALDRLVHAYAEFGPDTHPEAFTSDGDALAYYVNAYNVLVVYAVLDRDVQQGVHDVHGLIEPVEGMGFFWALRFRLDGAWVSLHGLENDILRTRWQDARVHAAINCASRSCPALAAEAYRGVAIDAQLDEASARFASEPRHVQVDDGARVIALSSIFTWYASDFIEDARAHGGEPSALGWIALHADARAREAIERARAADYAVQYTDYDWSLNGHR